MKVFSAVVALLFASSAAGEYDGTHLLLSLCGCASSNLTPTPPGYFLTHTFFLSVSNSKPEFLLINL